ncbi:MFS transporter [Pseudoxanthomonas sp.]|uniref:MFS transporter n=1 Tax=Pseudoxanthomonas sp. TaxID=1871049 RepID=UPI0026280604|nr:MFS transporter [Pseudoxanthomonas sp.]WDS35120.1 MAG: MFS transporter [Pseudoxanthomonas sp.]
MLSSPKSQQHATRIAFFIPGFVTAVWATIVPFAKHRTGMDEATLGVVLLCLGIGSLVAMPVAGVLAARQGCRNVMVASTLLMLAMLPLLALVATPFWLGATLLVFGAAMGAMDCTMNVQAVTVERESGRTMMSGFHAFYSIGGFVGAALMTLMLGLRLQPWFAALLAVVAMVALAAVALRHWRSDRVEQDAPTFAVPKGVVLLIGLLAFVAFLAEGAVLDWSAVFLTEVRQVDPGHAGLGYVVFSLAMTITRLLGDALVERFGRTRSIVLGGMLGGAGFLVATLTPVWQVALVGYALIGLGCANVVPALFSLTGLQRAMPESIAIPAVTTMAYAGVLAGPALIGFVAYGSSLVLALVGVAMALFAVALCAPWLRIGN